jgi:hypothetical protein
MDGGMGEGEGGDEEGVAGGGEGGDELERREEGREGGL